MILLVGIIIGLIIGRLSGGRFAGLLKPGFRGLSLPIVAFILQALDAWVFGILGLGSFHPVIVILSYSMCLLFYAINRRYPAGSLLGFAGTASNFAVIALNQFQMPVATNPLWGPDLSGHVVTRLGYALADGETVLYALGDVMALNIPLVGGVFSIGDIFIAAGCACLVISAMKGSAAPREARER